MNKKRTMESYLEKPEHGQILFYQSEDGHSHIEVRVQDETVWLSQRGLSELYQVEVHTINEHLQNIYNEGELDRNRTIRKFRIVRFEGSREVEREVAHVNLQAILSVGYRVRSHRGTQFRRWATERLHDYLVKGFALDDKRLKEMKNIGQDYFDELLERIREIRASEKRFYKRILDLYAISIDYDPNTEESHRFFASVQNKLHFAVTHKTAAELIAERADSSKPNMGLTTWKGAKVRRGDVTVAKNYLNADEISELNRIVNMYLDYAEDQAKRHNPVTMKDWREKLDAFLKFNEREILDNLGQVAHEVAETLALSEFDKYDAVRSLTESDDEEHELEKAITKLKRKREK